MSDAIATAAGLLRDASSVVVTTGAGMSRESGIPTFRDAPNALWANYDPMELATRRGFRKDPALVWRWYADRRAMIAEAKPHDGHLVIAEMEGRFDAFLLATQNIDNLHAEAGSRQIVELHGNIFRYKCFDGDHPCEELPPGDDIPPRCHCGSFLRPDVVWFGEMLDASHIRRTTEALEACDVILVVGTSGIVYPAAGFPATAKEHGARVIEINPEPTPITADADVFVAEGAAVALPRLLQLLDPAG